MTCVVGKAYNHHAHFTVLTYLYPLLTIPICWINLSSMAPDIFLPDTPSKTGLVYGLFASDEPLNIRYVGQTTNGAENRLRSHLCRSGRRTIQGRWFESVEARGAKIGMRILGEYPSDQLNAAEIQWCRFWSFFCDLEQQWAPPGCNPALRSLRLGKYA